MTIEEIEKYVAEDMAVVNGLMVEALGSDIRLLAEVNGTLLSQKGKQIRPLLTILMARTYGVANSDSLHYAAAAELLHNATLLHDDVADNSTVRRGHPTVKALLGDRASVLLGDFWLVKAMDQIFAAKTSSHEVMKSFSRTLSLLAEGEMLQLEKAENGDTTEADYYRIIFSKTGSLFTSAAEAAMVAVEAPEEMRSAARAYGKAVGMAFQVKDDILDYEGSEKLGKPLWQDLKESKITLPLLGALATVPPEMATEIRQAVTEVPIQPENIDRIVEFVKEHKGVEYAEAALQRHREEALKALEPFPDGEAKQCLSSLVEYIVRRDR